MSLCTVEWASNKSLFIRAACLIVGVLIFLALGMWQLAIVYVVGYFVGYISLGLSIKAGQNYDMVFSTFKKVTDESNNF